MAKKKASKEDGIQTAKRVFDTIVKESEKPIKIKLKKSKGK
jgi:hypothetical protein